MARADICNLQQQCALEVWCFWNCVPQWPPPLDFVGHLQSDVLIRPDGCLQHGDASGVPNLGVPLGICGEIVVQMLDTTKWTHQIHVIQERVDLFTGAEQPRDSSKTLWMPVEKGRSIKGSLCSPPSACVTTRRMALVGKLMGKRKTSLLAL